MAKALIETETENKLKKLRLVVRCKPILWPILKVVYFCQCDYYRINVLVPGSPYNSF